MTGVGMMDCKKALTAADGDKDKAIEWLREKGLAAQTKKAGKVAAEGVSYAIVNEAGVGVVVEVNSQTDFVAKNEVFQGFVKDVASVIAAEDPADVAALQEMTYPGTTAHRLRHRRQGALHRGEHPDPPLRPLCRGRQCALYPHGRKVGVLVNLAVEGIADMAKVVEVGKDVAMQICAMNPTFLDKSDVDQATLDKEKEILMVQAKEDPKTPASREYHREDGHGPALASITRRTACSSRPSSRRIRSPWRSTWLRWPSSWAARSPSRPSPASRPARVSRRKRTTSPPRSPDD